MGFPLLVRITLLRATSVALCFWLSALGAGEEVWAEGMDSLLQGPSSRSFLSITPSYYDRDTRAVIKLLDDGVKRDAVDFLVKSSLPGRLTGEGELAVSSFNSQTDKLYHLQRNQLLRFRLAGEFGSFGYGAEYRSVGPGFKPRPGINWRQDQEGTETWASQTVGPLRLKALFSSFWDNVEAEPHRPRTTRTMGGIAVGITLPGGSVLDLSYQRGTSATVGGPPKQTPEASWIEAMGASLYFYGGPKWDFTISSNFSPSINKLDPSKNASSYYHVLSGSYRPTESISITPSLTLSEQRSSWSGVRTVTPTSMLSLSYFPPSGNIFFTTYGFYSKSKSTEGFYDVQTVNLIHSLVWPFGKAKEKAISFDVVYTQHLDAVYRSSSYGERLLRVMYNVKAF